jgi:hypothetical protein
MDLRGFAAVVVDALGVAAECTGSLVVRGVVGAARSGWR